MTREEAALLVNEAIDRVVREDAQLLELDACERAVQFRLAHYLALSDQLRPPLTVDCEYNRHFGDRKKLVLPPRRDPRGRPVPSNVFPDILVHQRNSDDNNKLVLEIKRPGQRIGRDQEKLRAFASQLGYLNAAHVVVGRDRNGNIVSNVIWIDV